MNEHGRSDHLSGLAAPDRAGLVPTAVADLRGICRLPKPQTLGPQVARFAVIGAASTLAYLSLYTILRGGQPALEANVLALLVTTVGNTAANRRLTFGVRGRAGAWRDQAVGLVALGAALMVTTGSLTLLGWLAPAAGRTLEMAVLTAANMVATGIRFALLRTWIAPHAGPASRPTPQAGARRRVHRIARSQPSS